MAQLTPGSCLGYRTLGLSISSKQEWRSYSCSDLLWARVPQQMGVDVFGGEHFAVRPKESPKEGKHTESKIQSRSTVEYHKLVVWNIAYFESS